MKLLFFHTTAVSLHVPDTCKKTEMLVLSIKNTYTSLNPKKVLFPSVLIQVCIWENTQNAHFNKYQIITSLKQKQITPNSFVITPSARQVFSPQIKTNLYFINQV